MEVAPLPKSALGFHRILSSSAGVRVSPLCLGGMSFGTAWGSTVGECTIETAFEILDYFHERGGNFIDTANNYQDEQSEQWIGKWMEQRGVRDQLVIATKYSAGYLTGKIPNGIHSNYTGNNTKSLHVSLGASLKKLKTSYVDILYVHFWDYTASIPEVMHSLNTLANQGKILYLGVSDTPAWIVAKANQYARDHGLRPFVIYQGRWSVASRDFERDILPMCEAEGMGIAPWGALGGGHFKTEEQRQNTEGRKIPGTEADVVLSKALENLAKEKGTLLTSIALAYVMQKAPNVFPVVGCRTLEHLKGNIEALTIKLSDADIAEIDGAYPFDLGFPLNLLFMGQKTASGRGDDVFFTKTHAHIDTLEKQRPIQPKDTSAIAAQSNGGWSGIWPSDA